MKKIILTVFIALCFTVAKSTDKKETMQRTSQKTFSVSGINSLKNYEVEFKFFPQKKFVCGPAPKAIAFQNKLALERTQATIIPFLIGKNKNGFALLKLVA